MKTTQTLALFSATLVLAFAGSASAQETPFADTVPAATSAITRAEVEADRNLWLQSGLASYDGSQSADATVAGYASSVKSYRAARNSPAYMAELRRVQGLESTRMATGPTGAGKSE